MPILPPRSCLNCIFYSSLRRRCLKLGVIVEDPLNPPCMKEKVESIKIEKPQVSLKKEVEIGGETAISQQLIEILKKLDETINTKKEFIKNLNALEEFKEKIPPELYRKLSQDYNSKLAEIEKTIEKLRSTATKLGGIECPSCKSIILPGSKYCPKCGKKL